MVDAVEAMVARMEDAREYRRREVRRAKKEFQSRACDGGTVREEAGDVEVAVAVVEAWRTRQRDGVKNEEGVDVAVGRLTASAENLERGSARGLMTPVDERLRFEVVVGGVKKLAVRA